MSIRVLEKMQLTDGPVPSSCPNELMPSKLLIVARNATLAKKKRHSHEPSPSIVRKGNGIFASPQNPIFLKPFVPWSKMYYICLVLQPSLLLFATVFLFFCPLSWKTDLCLSIWDLHCWSMYHELCGVTHPVDANLMSMVLNQPQLMPSIAPLCFDPKAH